MQRLRKIEIHLGRFHCHLDLVGFIAFLSLAVNVFVITELSNTVSEVQSSRSAGIRLTCEEGNKQHVYALAGFKTFLVHNPSKEKVPPRVLDRRLNEFVSILLPYRNCAHRVKVLTKP